MLSNSQRIEQSTRKLVGKELTGAAIIAAVKATFPGLTTGVYPSDAAYTTDAKGKIVPRTNTQANTSDGNDGVLLMLANGKYRVLSDKEIVRKPKTGRGRRAASPVDTDKELRDAGFFAE